MPFTPEQKRARYTPKRREWAEPTPEEKAERQKIDSRRSYRRKLEKEGRTDALARFDAMVAAEQDRAVLDFISQGRQENGFSAFLQSPEARAELALMHRRTPPAE